MWVDLRYCELAALDAQAADRDAYLKLAGNLEGFPAQLRDSAATATTEERQRVLRLLSRTSSSARNRSPSR
ncbi:MAG: hypothetical protein ACRDOU_00245 [Streptosporangiaceae bacterium]